MTQDDALDALDNKAIALTNELLNAKGACPHCVASLIGRILGGYAAGCGGGGGGKSFSPDELIGLAVREAGGFVDFIEQQIAAESQTPKPTQPPEPVPEDVPTLTRRMH